MIPERGMQQYKLAFQERYHDIKRESLQDNQKLQLKI